MRRLATIVFLLAASQAWAAFGYYSPLTIQTGQVPGTETDFPILISVTDARLKTVGDGGHVQDAQGDDIRPYTDSALTTAITGYEKVFYDGTNGILEMWVKRSSVADGLVTYLAYGDAGITTDGSSTTTWSASFLGVYHLADGTTLDVNSATGSNNGTNHSATATTGKIDGGAGLASASTQYIDVGNAIHPIAITVSAWVKATSFPNSYNAVSSRNDTSNFDALLVKSTGKLACFVQGSPGNNKSYDGSGSNTLSTGTWYYLTMTYANGSALTGYVNAGSDGASTSGAFDLGITTTNPRDIGRDPTVSNQYWNGVIDEVRYASVVRSGNWITTEYNNQVAPGTFMVLGTEVPIAAPTNTGAFLQFHP